MLTVLGKSGKVQKEVFVIRRIEVLRGEHTGRIIHIVRSVKLVKGQWEQNDYQVITFGDQDGRVTCSCEARGNCCHMLEASCYDMRRYTSITPVKEPSLLEQVNAELAKEQAEPATQEELAATQARVLLPNSVDQLAYFIQHNRRAAEYAKQQAAIVPIKTPAVRSVSRDWLLKGQNNGTFSGRVA